MASPLGDRLTELAADGPPQGGGVRIELPAELALDMHQRQHAVHHDAVEPHPPGHRLIEMDGVEVLRQVGPVAHIGGLEDEAHQRTRSITSAALAPPNPKLRLSVRSTSACTWPLAR